MLKLGSNNVLNLFIIAPLSYHYDARMAGKEYYDHHSNAA